MGKKHFWRFSCDSCFMENRSRISRRSHDGSRRRIRCPKEREAAAEGGTETDGGSRGGDCMHRLLEIKIRLQFREKRDPNQKQEQLGFLSVSHLV